jgi:hypothetical protein
MDFKNKYLKYKEKYLLIKNQQGGMQSQTSTQLSLDQDQTPLISTQLFNIPELQDGTIPDDKLILIVKSYLETIKIQYDKIKEEIKKKKERYYILLASLDDYENESKEKDDNYTSILLELSHLSVKIIEVSNINYDNIFTEEIIMCENMLTNFNNLITKINTLKRNEQLPHTEDYIINKRERELLTLELHKNNIYSKINKMLKTQASLQIVKLFDEL